jgi:hypothetical protein
LVLKKETRCHLINFWKKLKVHKLNLSITAISSPDKILEIKDELDSFISKNSANPMIFSIFIQKEMESALQKGSTPAVLLFKTDQKIIGLATLSIKRKFILRYATSLFNYWFSPDLILDKKYEELCIKKFLEYVFNHLKCQLMELILPNEPYRQKIIGKNCKKEKILIATEYAPYLNHATIPIKGNWDDFQKSQGADWRHNFKTMKHKLDRIGSNQIAIFEDINWQPNILQKIIDIEKASWKQGWRLDKDLTEDEQLFNLLELSDVAANIYPDYKRTVVFLELNNRSIAYSFIIKYRGTAYIAKSTFDNQYRKLYPGFYTLNEAIGSLFKSGQITLIDFMTNIPATKKWAAIPISRVRLSFWNGFFIKFSKFIIEQPPTKIIKRFLEKNSLIAL